MRIAPSDPRYPVFDELWNLNAIAENPHIWMGENDLEVCDRTEILDALEAQMEALLDGLPCEFLGAMVKQAADQALYEVIQNG